MFKKRKLRLKKGNHHIFRQRIFFPLTPRHWSYFTDDWAWMVWTGSIRNGLAPDQICKLSNIKGNSHLIKSCVVMISPYRNDTISTFWLIPADHSPTLWHWMLIILILLLHATTRQQWNASWQSKRRINDINLEITRLDSAILTPGKWWTV